MCKCAATCRNDTASAMIAVLLWLGAAAAVQGLAHLNGLSQQPSASEMEQLTQHWRPFRSLGCYYMWRIPLPAAKRAAGSTSAAAKAAGETPSKKARQAQALASPLGAAVAAVADVGVNVFAPAVAAGTVAAALKVSACVASQQQQQPEQLDVGQPITPEKAAPGRPEDSSDYSALTAAAAGAGLGQGSGEGMMTRRRLRWAAGAAVPGGAAGSTADAPQHEDER
jgi:hypothetical protein